MDDRSATPTRSVKRGRAMLEAGVFVGGWVAIGLAIQAPVVYQLIGVPLTVAFQLWVCRRPLRELWVREGPAFRLDAFGTLLAALLMLGPAILLVRALTDRDWLFVVAYATAVVGAVPGAYAFRQMHRYRIPTALLWLAIATVVIVGWTLITDLPGFLESADRPAWSSVVGIGATHVLYLLPWWFVIEEVVFRGLLDTHVHRPSARFGVLSALYVSALWGMWHLPFAGVAGLGDLSLPVLLVAVVLPHSVVGIPLSFAWRRTGNLAVPALAHALGDAVREALTIVL